MPRVLIVYPKMNFKKGDTMKYILKDTVYGDIKEFTLEQVLFEINRDRSDEWTNYDESDWKEGLSMTDYILLKEVQ